MMIKNVARRVLIFFTLAIIGVAIVATLDKTMEAEQRIECLKWQRWQKQGIQLFRPSADQINICKQMGVDLKRKKEIEI